MTPSTSSFIGYGILFGIPFTLFYARPATVIERAHLLIHAEGSPKALAIARDATRQKYLSYFSYQETLKRIDRIVRRERAESILSALS
jgi:hypothetical protein